MKAATLLVLVLSFSACRIEYSGTVDVTPLDDAGVGKNAQLADPITPSEDTVTTDDAGTPVAAPTPAPVPDNTVVAITDPVPSDAGIVDDAPDAGHDVPTSGAPPPPAKPQILIDDPAQLAQLAGMTETPGDLWIRCETADLSVLKDLQVINGSLLIQYTKDTTTHLDNVTKINGMVVLRKNPNLENIGMPKLSEIVTDTLDGTSWMAQDNPKLSQCDITAFFSNWKTNAADNTGNGACK